MPVPCLTDDRESRFGAAVHGGQNPPKRQNRVLGGKTNVIQVTTQVSDGLMDVDYQWNRNGACGYTQWRILAPISSRIRRIQPPLEARVWAKSRAGGRFAGGWRRHRYVGPLVYASQLAP